MWTRNCIIIYCLIFLHILVCHTSSWAIVGDSEGAFGLDGSLRTIGAVTDNYDFEPFFEDNNTWFSQNILRLTAAGHPYDWLIYEVHGVQSLDLTSADEASSSTATFDLAPGTSRYRALEAGWDWLAEGNTAAAFWFDRYNTKFTLSQADFTIGRQAITFGKAYFWNPLDVFLPFDPRQFDRDYKAGVDAARLDISLGDFSGVNLIGALGREIDSSGGFISDDRTLDASWYGSSVLSRMFTNKWEWDWALQGGKIYGGYQLGGGTVGEIGPVEVRGEAAYYIVDGTRKLPASLGGDLVEDHLTAVVGLGHRFDNSLNLEGEYLYNGAGERGENLDIALARFASGNSLHMSRHLMGLMGSYEIYPILTGQLAWIFSFDDTSSQIQPGLSWSVSDEADLLAGASINIGEHPRGDSAIAPEIKSEFGTFPDVYYLELKVYF